jgi:hypothetical protein
MNLAPKSARASRTPTELWQVIQCKAAQAPIVSWKGIQFKALLQKVRVRAAPPVNRGRIVNTKPCSKKCTPRHAATESWKGRKFSVLLQKVRTRGEPRPH